MSVRASDLYQIPPDVMQLVDEARRAVQILRVELTRMENAGEDVAERKALLAAQEAQLALYVEHLGPGSAARYARMARSGQVG